MATRRDFLGAGLGALAVGLVGRKAIGAYPLHRRCPGTGALPVERTDPVLKLPLSPDSVLVDGLPFASWFTGDSFPDEAIPFHHTYDYFMGAGPPAPAENVDVAIVGGGLSGLATAYLLAELEPVVLELRDRFGGSASGEAWGGTAYSLGSAYVITPDEGSFLEEFYLSLGLDRVVRESLPPDPVILGGEFRDDFWSGAGRPLQERIAFERYAEVVTYMAEEAYPEIPLPDDPEEIVRIHALDRKTFRDDLEERMGLSLPPLLEAALQAYFYSSFGAGMQEISAASGWNFVAAEEFGRWVFPGGNSYMVRALWRRLAAIERSVSGSCRGSLLRAGCRVIDVRPRGAHVQVTYFDAEGRLRSLSARQVVMAGSKHIVKYVLYDLENWDPARRASMHYIHSYAYLVANVLLDAPIERDFYDAFLIGDKSFPVDSGSVEKQRPVIDMLRGDYARQQPSSRSVLTLYWPLPWPSARFTLLLGKPWESYSQRLVPQIREMLALLDVPESAVRQVRLTRWGHPMPIARPNFIADGHADRIRRPLGDNIHFVNQDNWALPAVENSLLEAQTTARLIWQQLAGSADKKPMLGLAGGGQRKATRNT